MEDEDAPVNKTNSRDIDDPAHHQYMIAVMICYEFFRIRRTSSTREFFKYPKDRTYQLISKSKPEIPLDLDLTIEENGIVHGMILYSRGSLRYKR